MQQQEKKTIIFLLGVTTSVTTKNYELYDEKQQQKLFLQTHIKFQLTH